MSDDDEDGIIIADPFIDDRLAFLLDCFPDQERLFPVFSRAAKLGSDYESALEWAIALLEAKEEKDQVLHSSDSDLLLARLLNLFPDWNVEDLRKALPGLSNDSSDEEICRTILAKFNNTKTKWHPLNISFDHYQKPLPSKGIQSRLLFHLEIYASVTDQFDYTAEECHQRIEEIREDRQRLYQQASRAYEHRRGATLSAASYYADQARSLSDRLEAWTARASYLAFLQRNQPWLDEIKSAVAAGAKEMTVDLHEQPCKC